MEPYAGFMKRLTAFLIDSVIASLLAGIFAGVVVGLAAASDRLGLWPESNTGLDDILGQLVITLMLLGSAVIVWLYWAKQESSAKQATLGKQAVGILVTDLDGRRITFRRATVRHFAKLVSAFPALVGFLLMLVTKRRQALHDMLAKTLVMSLGTTNSRA